MIYKPVYLTYDELRNSVATLPATDLKEVGKIYYKAPYIFINEINKGIHVIDDADPSSPKNIGFINIPGNIDMAIKDNMLYADSYIDLVTIDISDPANAKEVQRNQNVFPERIYTNGWMADPTKGVVINWVQVDTLMELDCGYQYPIFEDVFFASGGAATNANSSGSVASSSTVSPGIGVAGSMARFALYENYLYCLRDWSMTLFDITNAANPVDGATINMTLNVETIFPYDHYLFIGTTTGVSIYDNSNPSSPTHISDLSHVSSCDPVVVQGNYAYATLRDGTFCQGFTNELEVIDISNIYNPVMKTTVGMKHPFGLGIDGTNLFVCDDDAGLKKYNSGNPLALELTQTVDAGQTRDVIAIGNLLILVSTNGLYQFDYSSGELKQLSYLLISK